MITVQNGIPDARVEEAVLFAFDDFSIPFRNNLQLHLIHGKRSGGKPPIVIARGELGSADEYVHYYGTTMRIGDEFRMWYIGFVGRGDEKAEGQLREGRLCYAVSEDGVSWEKPDLGLVEYGGSKRNNLVAFPLDLDLRAAVVIHDPEDPDPDRRFKINYEAGAYGTRMGVAYSPDGLHWTQSPNNPVGPRFEQAGLIRWNGCYYVSGQGQGHPGPGRKMLAYASYDFEHWTEASVLGLNRCPRVEGPELEDRQNVWEEVHLGAAMHPRGNVILGIYGMWHGHRSGDPRYITMDLGLAMSHDAVHFSEPIPGFRFIPAANERESTIGFGPALMQGQGMENVGDRTLYWYSLWRYDGQVRLAMWDRDRFGYLRPGSPHEHALLITCPLRIDGDGQRIFLNISGLGEYAGVRVEVLDLQFRPIPGYSGDDCRPVRGSGLRVPARWRGGDVLPARDTPVRLKVDFGSLGRESVRPEDAKLYAIYVGER